MHTVLFLISSWGIILNLNAQSAPYQNMDPKNLPKIGIIKGTVVDQKNQAVEFASVSIFRLKDSSLVSGSISNELGEFNIQGLSFGRYFAKIEFISYKPTQVNKIVIQPGQTIIDLRQVAIEIQSENIDDVTITGKRESIEYRLDKKVINVSEVLTAKGGTAIDALENTPSIQTDLEGNITVRGSSNFQVFVNGVPSPITGSDALQQIPAENIETIEVITNPSAKYDPDGTAGIINVLLKKEKLEGTTGIVNLSAGTGDKYSGDITLNQRTRKFNNYLKFNYGDRTRFMTMDISEVKYREIEIFKELDRLMTWRRRNYGVTIGTDFTPNKKWIISLSSQTGNNVFDRTLETDYWETKEANTIPYTAFNETFRDHDFYQFNLNHIYKFDKNGHELSSKSSFNIKNGYNTDALDEGDIRSGFYNVIQDYRQRDDVQELDLRTQIDYVKPFKNKSKLEAGLFFEWFDESFGLDFQEANINTGEYTRVDSLSEDVSIARQIYAGYGMYHAKFKGIDYQIGLRAEYVNRLVTAIESFPFDQFNFFPSIHLSKTLNEKHMFMASFSRRIRRPREFYLNPKINFIDSETIRTGDPNLKPSFTNSYELSYRVKLKNSTISSELYYRQNRNIFSRVLIDNPNSEINYFTTINLGNSAQLGIESMVIRPMTNWWDMNVSLNIYSLEIEGDTELRLSTQQAITWNLRTMNTFKLPWESSIQIMASYNAPNIRATGKSGENYNLGIAYKHDFLKKKLTANLRVSSPLGLRHYINEISTLSIASNGKFTPENQVIQLSLSYKINNYKPDSRSRTINQIDFQGDGL